jgi:exosortase
MNANFRPTWKALLIAGMLGWAYWPTVCDLFQKWMSDPQYSHGILVPKFSLYLLYRNREKWLAAPAGKGAREADSWPWLGYTLMLAALGMRTVAALLFFLPLDALSLVVCLTGLVMVAGGKPMMRWTWQSLVFLLFMIPLPYQIERMMGAELQNIATLCSTFLLQSLGQPAVAEGNKILIREVQLGVVEACSGLRMLMTFAAFAVGAVFLMERHWLVKSLVLASAVPIALLTNILRITATGLAYVWLSDDAAKSRVLEFIHDFNGWMMMPIGLGFLVLELWLYKHLILEPKKVI